MKVKDLSVVYFVKGKDSEELRYSLRSLENLIGYKDVWIYGDKPDWVKDVNSVPVEQTGTKWQNTSKMYEMVCDNDKITDKFIVMNDDFFILEPTKDLYYWCEGNLKDRAERTKNSITMWQLIPKYSRYGLQLKEVGEWLLENDYTNTNFELHMPIVIDKAKMKKCLEMYPDGGWAARRSLYGNVNKVRSKEIKDCKIYSMTRFPNPDIKQFVSTTDQSFQRGSVGVWLRRHFTEKSKYEI